MPATWALPATLANRAVEFDGVGSITNDRLPQPMVL